MNYLLVNIRQLATCPPGAPQSDAGLIGDAGVAIEDGVVAWAGPISEIPEQFANFEQTDCTGQLVIPGLVDCHTHLCFGGWRGDEFAQRIAGASYQEIAAAGGGIRSTVAATREASADQLQAKARKVLDQALALGVTTMECKSGYGLDHENELKQLKVYRDLDHEHAIDLVPTFLGAHIVPPEFADDRDAYISLLCEEMLPDIAAQGLALFCDVFVEENAYSIKEAKRILSVAQDLGLGLKIHADQLSSGGGAELAAEMNAASAEHLEYISDAGIASMAASGTVAVSLPIASMYLGDHYLPARRLMEAGVEVAVATDFNPGSSPSFHLPLAMTLACINQRMTPEEALNGATRIAARAVGLQGKAGSLVKGSRADLVIIDADSLNQWLYHFRPNACSAVMKAGQWVLSQN
jgi:imidazolonepropionase